MVKQGILITPVLGEVLTNLAPLRMKHSASVPAYHKGKPTWLSLYLFACALTHPSYSRCARGKVYSLRIAASGLNLVARCAGKKPAIIPINVENTIASTTSQSGIAEILTLLPYPSNMSPINRGAITLFNTTDST